MLQSHFQFRNDILNSGFLNSTGSEFVYHPEFVYLEKKDTVTQNTIFDFNDFWSVTEHP